MYLKTLVMFLLYLVPYVVMISGVINHPWLIMLLWMIMGMGMAGIGLSVMHDANHGAYSKHAGVNRLFSCTLNILGGFAPNWQYQHNTMHHGYTNIDGYDEDIDPGKVLRFSPHKPHHKIYRLQHLYAWFLYGIMSLTWFLEKDYFQLARYRREGVCLGRNRSYRQLFLSLAGWKIFYILFILVIPIILVPVSGWLSVLGFLVMQFICGFSLAVIFQSAHVMPTSDFPLPDGNGNIENNWAVHQLYTTTDFSPKSRIFSWFIGGLNYQIEHHLFPNICHVHYKKISEIVYDTAKDFGLPYHVQPNFAVALLNHARMLKRLGKS
jgi:linoleoyl-CoA desaturase